ncbi:transposase family protein [Pseudonocardia sp.]|uniref:transposase family protein n=1 Tax=Pseudonocardia sp. TaxID=60912 RepID=UPI00262B3976|nr:transposase family protein [Pseudonocardia sp.]
MAKLLRAERRTRGHPHLDQAARHGQVLTPANHAYNTLLRSVRCRGERGFALLTGRWRALRRVTASPRRIGDHVKAALVLTHIEQVQLRNS